MIIFPLLVLIDNIIGTHDQRKTSLSALFSNQCTAADLYCDAEIAASGDRCNATLVVQRIEVIIQSLDVNSQLPLNCTFKRDGKNARLAFSSTSDAISNMREKKRRNEDTVRGTAFETGKHAEEDDQV